MRHARTPGRADWDTVRASLAEPRRKQMQERFIAAANLVKGKMRKRLEDDEKAIAERMSKVVEK